MTSVDLTNYKLLKKLYSKDRSFSPLRTKQIIPNYPIKYGYRGGGNVPQDVPSITPTFYIFGF